MHLAMIHLQKGSIPGRPSLRLQKNSLKRLLPHSARTSALTGQQQLCGLFASAPQEKKITQGREEVLTPPEAQLKAAPRRKRSQDNGPWDEKPSQRPAPSNHSKG